MWLNRRQSAALWTLFAATLQVAGYLALEEPANGDLAKHNGGDLLSMAAAMSGRGVGSSRTHPGGPFGWHLELNTSGQFGLDWTVDYAANQIAFQLTLNSSSSHFELGKDVLGLGFSADGQLKLADFCLIWFDLAHRAHLQDGWTDAGGRLELAAPNENHCRHLRHASGPGWLRFNFKRPLDICESKRSRYRIDNGTTNLIWLTLRGPVLALDGLELVEKANRSQADDFLRWSSQRAQLVAAEAPKRPAGEHSAVLDVRLDDWPLPADHTTYWCKIFRLPHKFETKRYHITRYEAIIAGGNEHVVHHMELFQCPHLTKAERLELSQSVGWSGPCGDPTAPSASRKCRKVLLAWAMGARPLEYPAEVGQSLGEGPGESPFVMLEVHYDNSAGQTGLRDNSGLRLHYTSHLRRFDAGILEVGLEYTAKNSIPPGLVAPLRGECHAECTRIGLTEPKDQMDGIFVFAGQLHTHLAGVASWTELLRGGRVIQELQRDDHYSPHFQEIRLLPSPVHVRPGDSLLHYCLYDTRRREQVTLGGFATSDEMCVTYLHYYPRRELEVCKSSIDSEALERYFSYLALEEAQPVGTPAASAADRYRAISWSARRGRQLLDLYADAPLSVQCNSSDGSRLAGNWESLAPARPLELTDAHEPLAKAERRDPIEYRGPGFGRRHAQCIQSRQQFGPATGRQPASSRPAARQAAAPQ